MLACPASLLNIPNKVSSFIVKSPVISRILQSSALFTLSFRDFAKKSDRMGEVMNLSAKCSGRGAQKDVGGILSRAAY
jgi:hypothetical protein